MVVSVGSVIGVFLLAVFQPQGLPPYQAPSTFDAMTAFNQSVESQLEFARLELQAVDIDDPSSDLALDMQLYECVWGREPNINPAQYGLANGNGYFCRFIIQPMSKSEYSDVGFFAHNGFQWVYVGRIKMTETSLGAELPRDKVVRTQPFVESPYLDGTMYEYEFDRVPLLDNTPYRQPSEGFYRLDPFSTRAGTNDPTITTYERDDYRRRRDLEDYIEFPKGTERRNQIGY